MIFCTLVLQELLLDGPSDNLIPVCSRIQPLCGILELLDMADTQQQGTGIIALDMLLRDQPNMLSDGVNDYESQCLVWHLLSALGNESSATQSAALRCLRAMADSPSKLCSMVGPNLEQSLLSRLGRGDLADTLNTAWLLQLLQRSDHVRLPDSAAPAASADVHSSWSRGLHPNWRANRTDVHWSAQAESACVQQLVQMLQGSAHELVPEAAQSKAEAACALDLLIRHRREVSGSEAATWLQSVAAEQGGLQALLQLLSSQASLQLHAVSALGSLVCNHHSNQTAVMQRGSLGIVIALCMSACPEVAESASRCVANLLHAWPGQPVALATKTALHALVSELDSPSQSCQDRAARALQLIASSREEATGP